MTTASVDVDVDHLTTKVQQLYREVATHPDGTFHFELGRGLAERVGYDPDRLAQVPAEAVESFAGVGFSFDLADLQPGATVVDLGSGSGMDVFYAAGLVGATGRVIGVDFTPEQLAKSRRLAQANGIASVDFQEARIEQLPLDDASVDCVISNGVINLAPDKAVVFAEAARVLRSGGRLAIADIVSERQLVDGIVCNVDLWASCIGGATQVDAYRAAIEATGLHVVTQRENAYEFTSDSARSATREYGVKSVSVLAVKP